MPKGSKVEEVENKLKKQYPPGTPNRDAKVFGTLNKVKLMHGNKVTAKGKEKAKKNG